MNQIEHETIRGEKIRKVEGNHYYGCSFDSCDLTEFGNDIWYEFPNCCFTNCTFSTDHYPKKGEAFTAYKCGRYGELIELEIPADAEWVIPERYTQWEKLRASKALVKAFDTNDDYVVSHYDPHMVYELGKVVEPDEFDPDPTEGCSHGIHFFLNADEAQAYFEEVLS